MTQHLHSEYVDGCYRCDLSRDEEAQRWIETDNIDWIDEVCDRTEDLVMRDLVYKLLRERDEARAVLPFYPPKETTQP